MDKRTFQPYLLAKMRADSRVPEALATLDATREDLLRAEAEAVKLGFETPGHAAQLYVDALGDPAREVPATRPSPGSTTLAFELEIFPGVELSIGRHPAGWASDVGFARRHGAATPPLATAADLSAWKFVRAEVTARFGAPEAEDAWSGWEELVYRMSPSEGRGVRSYLLRFDLGLLQFAEPLAEE